jgi:succinyl-CoA synthetase beta subunit
VGGIGFADDPAGAAGEAKRLLGSEVRGERVEMLLVEQRVRIDRELYLALVVDYAARQPLLMASGRGGVAIEEVAAGSPEQILRVPCSMLRPPDDRALAPVGQALGPEAAEVARKLYDVFIDLDAEMVEINPLVQTPDGLVAVDAVLNVNDDGLARHPELDRLRQEIPADDPLAEAASQRAWTYIHLGGEIGILSSGAGLTMTIVDLITHRGGSAANFLDTAQIDEQGIYDAFALLQRAPAPRVWLVNIFAGLNRCDRLAEGIVRYVTEHPLQAPLVVRMVGNLDRQGHRILRQAGIEPVSELEQAIDRCMELARSAGGAA